jgi:hypothetical protein
MRAVIRGLRARLPALLAVAVAVGVAAGFAALTATAWTVALPLGARADVASSPADSVVITKRLPGDISAASMAQYDTSLRQAVSADAPGVFTVSEVPNSSWYPLPGSTDSDIKQIYAVDTPSVRVHAVLSAGVWPSTAALVGTAGSPADCTKMLSITESLSNNLPPCVVVPAALPTTTAGLLHLRVGERLTLRPSPDYLPVAFAIVGEYRLHTSAADQAALAWNQAPAGVAFGIASIYGPLAVAPDAFTQGVVPIGTAQWLLLPKGIPSVSTLNAALAAFATDGRLSNQGFEPDTALSDELSLMGQRITAAGAQLLSDAVLLGLLAGLAVAAAAGNLVGRGAAQAALMRSRGAPAWQLAAVYLPDVALLLLAAAAGSFAQGPLLGRMVLRVAVPAGASAGLPGPGLGLSAAGWGAGAAVAVVAALIVLLRAARTTLPAQVAAASGRQAAVAGVVRAGADVALLGLAVVALWQAKSVGLATDGTNGGTGVVLLTACAPALSAAAGAALCGRLVTLAALLSERLGARARTLPARLAAWELARTPLRHVVPALLAVAAIAGCGYTAAEHASWQRSAHDQAGFQVGADVAVNLGRPATLDEAGRLAGGAGVLDATPVYREEPYTGPVTVGLDPAAAAHTVQLRPDQTGGSPAALWASITPSAPVGTALPGRPARLQLTAKLNAPGLTGTSVTAMVADATGLSYSVTLGSLRADGSQHTLVGQLTSDTAGLDYPLRLVSVGLSYQMPTANPDSKEADTIGGAFTVSGVAEQQSGAAAFTPVPGALAAIGSWPQRTNWNAAHDSGTGPGFDRRLTGADGSQTVLFNSGDSTGGPMQITMSQNADVEPVLPALATSQYLAANQESVGSTVSAQVDQATVKLRIVGSVAAFPAVGGLVNSQVLITDLGSLSQEVLLQDDPLASPLTWWLHTKDGAVPSVLPVAAQAAGSRQAQAALLADPLTVVPQRVLEIGAAALLLLALLGLLISLLAAAREATTRDTVLSALGMTRRQRATLACILHTAVTLPAGILGAGLGLLLSRLLVPVFVLSPQATEPQPPPVVLLAAGWPAAAAVALVALTALAAFAASARRRDPSATSRLGGSALCELCCVRCVMRGSARRCWCWRCWQGASRWRRPPMPGPTWPGATARWPRWSGTWAKAPRRSSPAPAGMTWRGMMGWSVPRRSTWATHSTPSARTTSRLR